MASWRISSSKWRFYGKYEVSRWNDVTVGRPSGVWGCEVLPRRHDRRARHLQRLLHQPRQVGQLALHLFHAQALHVIRYWRQPGTHTLSRICPAVVRTLLRCFLDMISRLKNFEILDLSIIKLSSVVTLATTETTQKLCRTVEECILWPQYRRAWHIEQINQNLTFTRDRIV